MSAPNCGLPEYKEGTQSVYAGKITAIEDLNIAGIAGCKKLVFGDLGKEANVLGYWAAQNSPEVGGWFVVPTTGGAAFMRDADFTARFTKVA